MRKYTAFFFALVFAYLAGCRLGYYELSEPLDGQVIEVKSGDRVSVLLDENATTGYMWMTECDDENVVFERETIPPDEKMCGAPGKVRITMFFCRGFIDSAHVKLLYKRPWKGGGTAREINLMFHRQPEDNAPWK